MGIVIATIIRSSMDIEQVPVNMMIIMEEFDDSSGQINFSLQSLTQE